MIEEFRVPLLSEFKKKKSRLHKGSALYRLNSTGWSDVQQQLCLPSQASVMPSCLGFVGYKHLKAVSV